MPDDDLLQHKSLVQPADALEMLKADRQWCLTRVVSRVVIEYCAQVK